MIKTWTWTFHHHRACLLTYFGSKFVHISNLLRYAIETFGCGGNNGRWVIYDGSGLHAFNWCINWTMDPKSLVNNNIITFLIVLYRIYKTQYSILERIKEHNWKISLWNPQSQKWTALNPRFCFWESLNSEFTLDAARGISNSLSDDATLSILWYCSNCSQMKLLMAVYCFLFL